MEATHICLLKPELWSQKQHTQFLILPVPIVCNRLRTAHAWFIDLFFKPPRSTRGPWTRMTNIQSIYAFMSLLIFRLTYLIIVFILEYWFNEIHWKIVVSPKLVFSINHSRIMTRIHQVLEQCQSILSSKVQVSSKNSRGKYDSFN